MVSVRLPSDALLQHLPSYLGFSYLGRGVSLHDCSSKAQPLLLTLDEGYLLTAALPDLQHRIAPVGCPVPVQPLFLGHGVAPPGRRPWSWAWDGSSQLSPLAWNGGWLLPAVPDLGLRVPLGWRWVKFLYPSWDMVSELSSGKLQGEICKPFSEINAKK